MKGERITKRINEIRTEMYLLDDEIVDCERRLLDYERRYKELKYELRELRNNELRIVSIKSHKRRIK